MTEAQKKAIRKYKQKNIVRFTLELNRTTDCDILEWLDAMPNMSGAIKDAIREYKNRHMPGPVDIPDGPELDNGIRKGESV